jgi:hypothetical protein
MTGLLGTGPRATPLRVAPGEARGHVVCRLAAQAKAGSAGPWRHNGRLAMPFLTLVASRGARGVPEVSPSYRPLVFMDQSTEDVTAAQLTGAGVLAASPLTDGMGEPRPRLRCGRRRL